jgi:Mrp family chromosome partitioning ATPase
LSASGEAPVSDRSVLSRWRLIFTLALLGLALGFGWGIADKPLYRATATVAVESDSQGAEEARLERFAQRGESDEVATKAAGLLGDDVAGADLLSTLAVRPAPQGGALILSATSESPDLAVAAADGFAEALVEVEGDPLALGAAAELPSTPAENRPAGLCAAVGLLIGALLGLIAAAALSISARRVRASKRAAVGPGGPGAETSPRDPLSEFAAGLGADLIGAFAGSGRGVGEDPSGVLSLGGDDLEAARYIADRIGLGEEPGPRSIAVVEVGHSGNGSSAAACLATAAADLGGRVLLVEADLGEPDLAARLGIATAPGLHDYLDGGASPSEVLRTVRVAVDGGDLNATVTFACVPAGRPGPGASIAGLRFEGLAGRLARVYDLVVYLAPPVPGGGDAEAISELVDGVVVLVDVDAPPETLDPARDQLSAERVLGVVVADR